MPPGRGEHDVLGEELANQTSAPGAERCANGHLALARRAARQRQVREIGAANQQQHADRAQEHVQGAAQLRADHRVHVANDRDAPAFVRVGKILRDAAADRVHFRARLLHRYARLEPCVDLQPVEVARPFRRGEGKRPPHLIERPIEHGPFRQHTNDRERLAVERDRSADDSGVAAELRRPQPVADDDDVLFAWQILVGGKRPAELGFDAEDVKVGADTRATRINVGSPVPESVIERPVIAATPVNDELWLRQSRKFIADTTLMPPPGGFSHSSRIRSGSGYGSGFRSTPSTKLKMALLAPMPRASVRMATAAKPRAFNRLRTP
jgi:hypothetical protein